MFPVITQEIQKAFETHISSLSEEEAKEQKKAIPCICGILGRGCRCIGNSANHLPCIQCSLAMFAEKNKLN